MSLDNRRTCAAVGPDHLSSLSLSLINHMTIFNIEQYYIALPVNLDPLLQTLLSHTSISSSYCSSRSLAPSNSTNPTRQRSAHRGGTCHSYPLTRLSSLLPTSALPNKTQFTRTALPTQTPCAHRLRTTTGNHSETSMTSLGAAALSAAGAPFSCTMQPSDTLLPKCM